MYYVPQPIGVYSAMELQGFRKGNCAPYENRVLCNGDLCKFTNVMVKRLTVGGTATVTIVTLDDEDVFDIVPPSQNIYSLDAPVDAYEMLVLNAGNWESAGSINPGNYYLRIDDGSNTYYTDAIYFEQSGTAEFPQCSDGWVKMTWMDGRCISADTSTDGVTPVMAYPDLSHSFFIFLEANLSQPEWATEEQGSTDAAGVFIPTSRRLAKRWKLEGYPVSESVIDALQSSALFEDITIEFPSMPAFSAIRDIKIAPTWEQGGCFARYEYTFTTDYLLKQGCC